MQISFDARANEGDFHLLIIIMTVGITMLCVAARLNVFLSVVIGVFFLQLGDIERRLKFKSKRMSRY